MQPDNPWVCTRLGHILSSIKGLSALSACHSYSSSAYSTGMTISWAHGYHTEAEAVSSGGFWAKVTKPGLATPCTPYQDKLSSAKLPLKSKRCRPLPTLFKIKIILAIYDSFNKSGNAFNNFAITCTLP